MEIWMILILLFFVGLLFNYIKWKQSSVVRTINKIPGPRGYPFLGNLPSIPQESDERLAYIHRNLAKKYGSIFRLWFWARPVIFTSSPHITEKLLGSQGFIEKGKSYDAIRAILGDGLLLAAGEKWKRNRRLLTPSFHFRILDQFFDVFCDNGLILSQILLRDLNALSGTKGTSREIDVTPYLFRCTLDVICETAMGVKIKAQTEDSKYVKTVGKSGKLAAKMNFSPWQFFPKWMYQLFSSEGREWNELTTFLNDFGKQIIQERKKEMETQDLSSDEVDPSTGLTKRRPFLDLLLIEAKKGADLSDSQIQNEVDTFMVAGHDTTAVLMTWFLYLMGSNPHCQKLAREEIDNIFGDSDRDCTIEDVTQMKYLECCVKETLRMYPSIALIERSITRDIELEGYLVPSGTSVCMMIYANHYNEEWFPDPFNFKPERFQKDYDSNDAGMRHHPYAYTPFGAGPRNCIGQKYALLEAKTILSMLIRRFQFTYDGKKHGIPKPGNEIVLKPKGGMPLIITPITKAKHSK